MPVLRLTLVINSSSRLVLRAYPVPCAFVICRNWRDEMEGGAPISGRIFSSMCLKKYSSLSHTMYAWTVVRTKSPSHANGLV